MKDFETIDISGDVGLKIYGDSLSDLFRNAARGLYSLMADISGIDLVESRNIKASGESLEGLLIAFLNELIFHFDTEGFTGREIVIEHVDINHVEATLSGDRFDADTHEPGLLIKAATYHNAEVVQRDGSWTASVIFDI